MWGWTWNSGTYNSIWIKTAIILGDSIPREPIPKAVKEAVLKRDKNKCIVTGFKKNLELHHVVEVASGGKNEINNIVTLNKEVHDIIHRKLYLYPNYKTIENKTKYINNLKYNYNKYKEENNIKIIIAFLYKLLRLKRSGIDQQTKAELRIWLKYIKDLLRKGYSIEIILYVGCSKVSLDYVILSKLKE